MNLANRNFLIFILAAALAAAAPACGSSDSSGGGGDDKTPDTGAEDCFNGEDDDGDGAVDCLDPDCLVLDECTPDCTAQVPNCEADQKGAINRVCVDNVCDVVGQVSENGSVVRGAMTIYSTLVPALEAQAGQNRAYLVEFIHPRLPDGSAANCDALVDAARSGGPVEGFNVVGSASGGIQLGDTTIPALVSNIAVPPEGMGWLVLSRLYGSIDNGTAAGELKGLGCVANVVVPPGPWADDAAHAEEVRIQPVCSMSDPNSCPGELTCLAGALVCRDQRCESCTGARVICRDVDGSAECLQRCDPNTIDTSPCPPNHRCDTTPGLYPACIPLASAQQ